jgi:thioredoxin 1
MNIKSIYGLCLVFLLVQCTSKSGGQNGQSEGNLLTPQDFKTKIASVENAMVLDVRTPEEFKTGHIKNAKNINFYAPDFQSQISQFNQQDTIFVYCKSGGRSGSAASKLAALGYTVYDLKGGIMKWNASKLPVVTGSDGLDKPIGMSKADYDSLTSSHKLVFVDFYAPWCSPCLKMSPHLAELKEQYKDKVYIQKIDIDQNKELESALGIEGIPLLVLFKDGVQVETLVGYQSKEALKTLFDSYL